MIGFDTYLPLAFAAVFALVWVAKYTWSFREARGASWLAVLFIVMAVSSMLYALPITVTDEALAFAFVRLRGWLSTVQGALLVLFMLHFVNVAAPARHVVSVTIAFALVYALVVQAAPNLTPLVYAHFDRVPLPGGGQAELLRYGTLWFISRAINVALLAGAFVMMIRAAVQLHGQVRRRLLMMALAFPLLWLLSLPVTLVAEPPPILILTPAAYLITGVLARFVLLDSSIFAMTPLAYRALFSELSYPALLANDRGVIQAANAAATRLFAGHTIKPGQTTLDDLGLPPAGQPAHWRDADGQFHDLSRVAVTTREGADLVGEVLLFNDASERLQTEAERAAISMERGRMEALVEMSRHLSHELRTPLAVIGTALHVARRVRDLDKIDERLGIIEAQSARIQNILEEFRTLSRLENPNQLSQRPLSIDDLTRAVCASLAPTAEAQQITLMVNTQANSRVYGEVQLLRSAMVHLIHNAIAFTPVGGKVSVQTRVQANAQGHTGVALEVSDTGVGIPPELIAAVLQPFYKANSARTALDGTGAGLGLTIAHQVAQAHRGTLSLASTPNQGTTVMMWLPKRGPSEARAGSEQQADAAPGG